MQKEEVDNKTPLMPDPSDPAADKVSDADLEAAINGVKEDPAPEVSKDSDSTESPTDKVEEKSEEFNAQQSFAELKEQYEQQQKNYEELRAKATRDWQAKAELERQHTALQASFEDAVKRVGQLADSSIDPEQWMEDLRTHGPKKIDERIEQRMKEIEAQRKKVDNEVARKNAENEFELSFLRRVIDTKNYPGFADLESKMNELAAKEDCPVNKNAPIGQVLDSLYKLAKDSSSGEAVKKAHEDGKRKAEEDLAKEAKTTLASGGKAGVGVPINLWKVPLEQLRKTLPKADRD